MGNFTLVKLEDLVQRVKVGFVGQINEFYCKEKDGISMIRTTDLSESGINYSNIKFVTKEFHQKNKKSQIRKGDVLIARHGDNGKASVFKGDFEAQVLNAIIIEPNQDVLDSELIKLFFESPYVKKQILGAVKGSIQGVINTSHVANLLIPLNRDIEYRQVSKTISLLDQKIELNNRINAEFQAMAKTLYDYWFVQFDFPDENGKPYKSAGGEMVWNEKLGKEIPEGWQVKPLGKALKTNLGGTPSTKNPEYWENATIPWLNSGDLTEFPIIKSSSFVTKKGVDNSATTILPKGSVVISLVRYIRPSIIALEACANQSVVGIRETEELKNSFIYPYFVNEVPRLMSLRTGAQQPHINKETIDDSSLCIPPASVLKEYYKVSEPIYKKIINVAFQSQTLTELRDWLLPMLMNGQVKV